MIKRACSFKYAWLILLAMNLLLTGEHRILAQNKTWSSPVMISTNTTSSWFSDVAVDDWGQPYVVWNSGRSTAQGQIDLLMYSTIGDQGWLEPNDIQLTAHGGYTVRPAIAIDKAATLHVTFRGKTEIYYSNSPAPEAWKASSWTPPSRISDNSAYYSDIAIDEQDNIHVVWNESVSAGVGEKWLWFGSTAGSAVHDGTGWRTQEPYIALNDLEIYAIFEDSAGAQWFGTRDGVYRFDGHAWQKVGLSDRKVNCITQDADGAIWFGTDEGISLYDERRDNPWTFYSINDGLLDNQVHSIAIDRYGNVWAGTEKGLSHYDGQHWINYFLQDNFINTKVSTIAIAPHGEIWIGTTKGASQYTGENWRSYTIESGLISNVVTTIAIDQKGAIWFGTDKGLSKFDGQKWESWTAGAGLASGAITALTVDSEEVVWAGTEHAVSSYDGQSWQIFELPSSFIGQRISAISEDLRVNVMCPLCADVFYRQSTDGGKNWSAPINLSNSFAGSVKPQVHVGKGNNGNDVYVTWEEGEDWYTQAGYPVAVMYIHSPDGGNTWTEPVTFPSAQGIPQQVTMGTGQRGKLVTVWRLAEENLFYYQSSTDNGASWSQPQSIPGVIAKPWEHFSLDAYDTATDSDGNIHLLVLGRLYSLEEDLGLIHLVWNGAEWSSPTLIYASSDPPEWPRIDVGAGNQVYATWFTRDERHIWDSEKGRYKVWVSSYQTDAPLYIPTLFPASSPTLTLEIVEEKSSPVPTLSRLVTPGNSGLPSGLYTESDEIFQLLLALSPVCLVILIVVAFRWAKFRSQK